MAQAGRQHQDAPIPSRQSSNTAVLGNSDRQDAHAHSDSRPTGGVQALDDGHQPILSTIHRHAGGHNSQSRHFGHVHPLTTSNNGVSEEAASTSLIIPSWHVSDSSVDQPRQQLARGINRSRAPEVSTDQTQLQSARGGNRSGVSDHGDGQPHQQLARGFNNRSRLPEISADQTQLQLARGGNRSGISDRVDGQPQPQLARASHRPLAPAGTATSSGDADRVAASGQGLQRAGETADPATRQSFLSTNASGGSSPSAASVPVVGLPGTTERGSSRGSTSQHRDVHNTSTVLDGSPNGPTITPSTRRPARGQRLGSMASSHLAPLKSRSSDAAPMELAQKGRRTPVADLRSSVARSLKRPGVSDLDRTWHTEIGSGHFGEPMTGK
eukprot:gnl/TRDRNA2_/TRDRNA2_175133_c0_seq12.p1 gnl/TRDRNA2_/TRDRNA2_175133_c0~~gnl/TRDRNA2_/TRDRNA2_175133_c0_seq12.p1  ORF type:complete len:431 (+),score=22.87 gnl/TRDRNA2_/TRDRNA2_175133_c0_seq12:144-1295(+)